MGYLRAILSKRLWLNWMIALLVFVLVVWGIWMWMGSYTRHGSKVLVPQLTGLTFEEAADILGDRNLKGIIVDSVFTEKVDRGTVFAHTPEEGQEVKPDRKVYITMNASSRKVLKMPDLMNQSKRQAISMLELIGLQVGKVEERKDQCDGCVVDQRYNGRSIEAGESIRQGEKVDLVLGSGLDDEEFRNSQENDSLIFLEDPQSNNGSMNIDLLGNSSPEVALTLDNACDTDARPFQLLTEESLVQYV
jgi:beta-lactam-binding protein with PASTA domain